MNQIDDRATGRYADEVREHEFDGIEEFDNHLPGWWLWSFYLACIFSLFYWLYYHGLSLGESTLARFQREMEAAGSAGPAAVSEEALVELAGDPSAVAAGKEVFAQNCIACHGEDGGGNAIGPNLTDDAWIHGGAAAQIHHTVFNGVTATAMLPWGAVLGPTKVKQVTAYVLTLRNTNVDGGKAPEGERLHGN